MLLPPHRAQRNMPRLTLRRHRFTFSLTPATRRPPASIRFPIRARPILTTMVVATLTTAEGILTITARRSGSVWDMATAGTTVAVIAAEDSAVAAFTAAVFVAAGLAVGGMAAGDMAAPVGTANCGRLSR